MMLVSTSVCCTSSFTGQLGALRRPHSLWDSLTSLSHLPGFGGEVHPHWAPRASQCPHPTTATSTTQVALDLNSTHTVITFPFLMHFHLCGPTSPSESPCLWNVRKLLSGRRGGCPRAHSAVWAGPGKVSAVGPPTLQEEQLGMLLLNVQWTAELATRCVLDATWQEHWSLKPTHPKPARQSVV